MGGVASLESTHLGRFCVLPLSWDIRDDLSQTNNRGAPPMNKNHRIKLVTVSINGNLIQVDPNSLIKDQRKLLHGKYKGTQVNSPSIAILGDRPDDSVIFWPDADKRFAVVMTKPGLGMLSKGFLEAEGHTITQA